VITELFVEQQAQTLELQCTVYNYIPCHGLVGYIAALYANKHKPLQFLLRCTLSISCSNILHHNFMFLFSLADDNGQIIDLFLALNTFGEILPCCA